MVKETIPEQGDIIYLDFGPQVGHEQKGRRPTLVISTKAYTLLTKLLIVCPITSKNKNFPFHVQIGEKNKTKGVVMCEQIKTIDYISRHVTFFEKIDKAILWEVTSMISDLIEFS